MRPRSPRRRCPCRRRRAALLRRRRRRPGGAPSPVPACVDGSLVHAGTSVGATLEYAPVIAATSSSIVAVSRSKCAERRPKRSTSTRSATSMTSGKRVRDQHHAESLIAHPSDEIEHPAGLDDAEGGGRLVEEDHPLGPQRRTGDGDRLALPARQQATGTEGSCTVVTSRSANSSNVRRRIARLFVNTRPRRISRPRNTLAAASRCGARARSWYTVSMPRRWASSGERKLDRLAVEQDHAVVGRLDARQHLDERRLAGAVVADQRRHRAGLDDEVRALQGVDGAERLDEAATFEHRNGRITHASMPPVVADSVNGRRARRR